MSFSDIDVSSRALFSVASILARLRIIVRVLGQEVDVAIGHRRHGGEVEVGEGPTQRLTLAEDHRPGQAVLDMVNTNASKSAASSWTGVPFSPSWYPVKSVPTS